MLRYLAWMWDEGDEASALQAAELGRRTESQGLWSVAFARPGLAVHVTGCCPRASEVYPLGNSGVILRKLFVHKEGGLRPRARGVIEELQRYTSIPIRIADPRLLSIDVTGELKVDASHIRASVLRFGSNPEVEVKDDGRSLTLIYRAISSRTSVHPTAKP